MNNNQFIQDLARKAVQGDVNAFQELYQSTRQRAYFVALSITKNEHDAQDILQDSYLKAYQSLSQLEQPEAFVGWLNRIVANKAKNYIARVKPECFADYEDDNAVNWQEETDPDFLPGENLDQAEAKTLIAALVKELPEDQRLVVLMRYYNDMDVTEVSSTLEIPEGTVKSRLSRARVKLAAMLRQAQSKGIQLYSLAPVPLLAYFIKLIGFDEESGDRLPALLGLAAAGGTAAAGTAAASTAAKAGAGALTKSIAIAAAAAVVATGAGIAGVYAYKKAHPAYTAVADVPSQVTLDTFVAGTQEIELPSITIIDPDSSSVEAGTAINSPAADYSAFAATSRTAKDTTKKETEAATSKESQIISTTKAPETTTAIVYTTIADATTRVTTTRTTTSRTSFSAWQPSAKPTTTTKKTTTTGTEPDTKTEPPETTAEPETTGTHHGSQYVFDARTNLIMEYTGSATDIDIPAEIDGVAVKHLAAGAFAGSAVESVRLPDGIHCIRSRTFADCASLREIEIPNSVVRIDADAFDGCSSSLTIVCREGSDAYKFSEQNSIRVQIVP